MAISWVLGLCLVFLEIVGTLVLGSTDGMRRLVEQDTAYTVRWLGQEETAQITESSARFFRHWFIDTGLMESTLYLSRPTEPLSATPDQKWERIDNAISTTWENRVTAFWGLIYNASRRLLVLGSLLPYLLVLIAPAVVDGLVQRQIRKYRYGDGSPTLSKASHYALGVLSVFPLVYLFTPFSLPCTVLILWGILVSSTLLVSSSNLQKKL